MALFSRPALSDTFNWNTHLSTLHNLMESNSKDAVGTIATMALEDIDSDGILECLVRTVDGKTAVFTAGKGGVEAVKDQIELVTLENGSTITFSTGKLKTYQGASPGYEDEHIYIISKSRVTEMYSKKSEPVRRNDGVSQATSYLRYDANSNGWKKAKEADYAAKAKMGDGEEYDFQLEWQPVSSTSFPRTLDDLVMWNAELSQLKPDQTVFLCNGFVASAAACINANVNSQDPEWEVVRGLVTAELVPLPAEELLGLHRVRSIQIDGGDIYGYNYFKCAFTSEVLAMNFDKTSGSQRRAGSLARVDDMHIIMEGCSYIGGDKKVFDDEHFTYGVMMKTKDGKYFMLIPRGDNNRFEFYLFAK